MNPVSIFFSWDGTIISLFGKYLFLALWSLKKYIYDTDILIQI